MLGIGKIPDILETREIEGLLLNSLERQDEGDETWIISPYNTMDKLSSIRRSITEACKCGVSINYVVRDEPDQVNAAVKHLKEATEYGLQLYAFHRLHAKVYWFEHDCGIVTSANLVDGSFESSTEIGLLVPAGGLHEQLRGWIKEIIEPGLRVAHGMTSKSPTKPRTKSRTYTNKGSSSSGSGFCIRCGKSVPRNLKKPYCLEHYKSWANYSNPEYPEKHCHVCGDKGNTSMVKPRCYKCFKKEER